MKGTGRLDSHDHAEHHEDIPQGDEDPEVSEAQQELPDVVTWKVRKASLRALLTCLLSRRSVFCRFHPPPPTAPRSRGSMAFPVGRLRSPTLPIRAVAVTDQPLRAPSLHPLIGSGRNM